MQERKLRREVSSDFIVPQKDVLAQDFDVNVDAYVVDKELAEVRDKARRYLDSNSAEAYKDTISLANLSTNFSRPPMNQQLLYSCHNIFNRCRYFTKRTIFYLCSSKW
jgi:hypothetical protein